MDTWCWLLPLLIAFSGFFGFRLTAGLRFDVNGKHTAKALAAEKAKLAKELGYYSEPKEMEKDLLRKRYLELGKSDLTQEDMDWVADQFKLTGFDPTKKRYNIDGNPRRYFCPGGF